MKKLLSILVIFGMILSMACVPTAFAEDVYTGTIDENGNVLFEFEKGTLTGTYTIGEAPDGTGYIYYNDKSSNTANVTGEITLNSTGYYKVTYLLGENAAKTSGQRAKATIATLSIGDYSFSNYSHRYTKVITDNKYQNWDLGSSTPSIRYMAQFEQVLWFDKGKIDIELDLPCGTASTKYLRYQADYIMFEYLNQDDITFDFCNYTAAGGVQRTEGNMYQYYGTSTSSPVTDPTYITIPMTVTKSGKYNVVYLISAGNGSDIDLNLKSSDGNLVPIGNNDKVGETPETSYSTTYGDVYKYSTTLENIKAGEYEILATISPTSNSRHLCYLDSIQFTLLEESQPENTLTEDNSTVTANVYYDEAISGEAILALYSGTELVGLSDWQTLENATSVTLSATPTKAYTKAKVFVWDGTVNMDPKVGAVTFGE